MYRLLAIAVPGITLLALIAHYLLYGPKHREAARENRTVPRFSLWERLIHILTMAAFLTLAVTGFTAVIGYSEPVRGWLLIVHWIAGPVFALGLTAMTLTWCEVCRFAPYDLEWARKAGGYLGGTDDPPAGLFNGGQKAFFWTIIVLGIVTILSGVARMFPVASDADQALILTAHRYASLLLTASILVHLYLGTIANPGTAGAAFLGKVSETWALHHHPNWAAHLKEQQGDSPNHEE